MLPYLYSKGEEIGKGIKGNAWHSCGCEGGGTENDRAQRGQSRARGG